MDRSIHSLPEDVAQSSLKLLDRIFTILLVVVFAAGLGACLYVSFKEDLTQGETLLVSLLVSILSMMASWFITHKYSQTELRETTAEVRREHSRNIKTYAVKAAEKVLNLSNELSRLHDFLMDARDSEAFDGNVELLTERITAAMHSIETLRSMNKTFLSDWRGVIGEEIQQQRHLEEQILEITQELRKQRRIRDSLEDRIVSWEQLEPIQDHIDEIESRLDEKLAQLPFDVAPLPQERGEKRTPSQVAVVCTNCGRANLRSLRVRRGARRIVTCDSCKIDLRVVVDHKGELVTTPVGPFSYKASCPLCRKKFSGTLSNAAGSASQESCPHCKMEVRVTKQRQGVKVRPLYRNKYPEKLMSDVANRLPKPPWPTGIHKEIAEDLDLSNRVITKIIGQLIKEGRVEAPPKTTTSHSGNGA